MVVQTMGAFFAVLSFALILEVPRKYVFHAGFIGAACWVIYLISLNYTSSVIVAAFVSTLVVAFISHIFARRFKVPVTVFLVAGILPSVPGASIYRSVYYMIRSVSDLSSYYLTETLQIAGAIAMAVFIMDSLFRLGQKN
ncbi:MULTISPECIES: threonine/serine exporter family protein [Hungatella]|uniref:Threonine/serine exporter n=1 Tax=Hungatella hathewayi TaxID=154046 RepID=A0AAW9WPZ2_9FIRM|nr:MULTISPECIES: threonine/serine exporter family protein [Hungatella]MCQ4832576.1 threonine/serine exporter family protein [Hungatella sp. SL.1.14]MUB66706.1 threonine/serine exporter [Hungatella hathewayi]CUQ57238.1 membrane spanning protein [Hungatella hathewayi]